jgi:CO dehydrogenase nickel-insertion accessory protein CooC1
MNDNQKKAIIDFAEKNDLEILDFVPFDQGVIEKDMQGVSPLSYKELKAVRAIDAISGTLIGKNI